MLAVVAIAAFVIGIGAGCFSMKNIREISVGLGGVDAEFYEPKETEQ